MTKEFLGLRPTRPSMCPARSRTHFAEGIGARGRTARDAWEAALGTYRSTHADLAAEIGQMMHRDLPDGWDDPARAVRARRAGDRIQGVLREGAQRRGREGAVAARWSADLAPSTKTRLDFDGAGEMQAASPGGRNAPLRHPRARCGRDLQRPRGHEAPSVLVGLPDLLRLRAGPSGCRR